MGGGDVGNPRIAGVIAFLALTAGAQGVLGSGGVPDGAALDGVPGASLPLNATFRDETGAAVRLGDLVDRPLLVTFVSFSCSRQCPLVLGGLADALGRLPLRPGEDYSVATISIDEHDAPADAAAAKRNYLAAVGRPFPAPAWRFLTGDRETIRRATDAVGLRFQRDGEHLFHPEALVAVAPGGVVSSFLPVDLDQSGPRARVSFPPAQLQLALEDARRGRVVPGRPQSVLFCFPFERDPERAFHRYLRVFGILNLIGVAAVAAWLLLAKRRPAPGKAG